MEYFISVICTKYMYQMTEWLKMSTNISLEPKPKCLSHEDILWKSTFSWKGRQLSLFLHSFIFLSCFPRPVRWSSASVCRIYEWTGWFPYLIYFPYEETLVGCWVLHPYGCCEKHPPTLLLPLVPLFVLVFQHQSPGIWSKVLSMISHHFRPLS